MQLFVVIIIICALENKQSIDHLLEPCKRGDRKAQELLYSSLAPKLYGICMRYAKDDHEAQDILQVGFVKIFKNIASFRGEGSFEGWFRRIMVNVAVESYHKRKSNKDFVDIDTVHDLTYEGFEMDTLEVQDLLRLIRKLPEGFRMVFNMFAIEGYTHKEISKVLNISEGTSKSQLSRARNWLKEKLKIMEGDLYGISEK